MPKPGPRTTCRYTREFKATAVRLSQLPGVAVGDVAQSLYIHPFMLSRWRKQAHHDEGCSGRQSRGSGAEGAASGEEGLRAAEDRA